MKDLLLSAVNDQESHLLIKSLIIDDCGMSDEAFEQLLLGLVAQNELTRLHYINNNALGHRSAALLSRLCRRDIKNNHITEFNISNVQIAKTNKDCPENIITALLYDLEVPMKIRNIKFSNLDLNNKEITDAMVQMLESCAYIQYFNISNCNIQLGELVKITEELKLCCKLEYCNLGGNKVSVSSF